MPLKDGVEMLRYIGECEADDLLRKRWLAPVDSYQSRMSFDDFKASLKPSHIDIKPASSILAEVETMMEGL